MVDEDGSNLTEAIWNISLWFHTEVHISTGISKKGYSINLHDREICNYGVSA